MGVRREIDGMRRGLPAVLALLFAAASPLALAQSAPTTLPAAAKPAPPTPRKPRPPVQDDDDTTVSELVVKGKPPPGSVTGDIKPDIVLSPQEVQSYGVDTVDDLLNELAPQTSTGPGSPAASTVLARKKGRSTMFTTR